MSFIELFCFFSKEVCLDIRTVSIKLLQEKWNLSKNLSEIQEQSPSQRVGSGSEWPQDFSDRSLWFSTQSQGDLSQLLSSCWLQSSLVTFQLSLLTYLPGLFYSSEAGLHMALAQFCLHIWHLLMLPFTFFFFFLLSNGKLCVSYFKLEIL